MLAIGVVPKTLRFWKYLRKLRTFPKTTQTFGTIPNGDQIK